MLIENKLLENLWILKKLIYYHFSSYAYALELHKIMVTNNTRTHNFRYNFGLHFPIQSC